MSDEPATPEPGGAPTEPVEPREPRAADPHDEPTEPFVAASTPPEDVLPGPAGPRRPAVSTVVLALLLAVAIVAAAVGWNGYRGERDDARTLAAQVDALDAELEAARDEIARLEEELAAAEREGLGDVLGDLLGGDLDVGDLDRLLRDLLGGDLDVGDLDRLLRDLLGGDGGDLDLGGLLEGLLGGDGDAPGIDLYGLGGIGAVIDCSDLRSLGTVDIPDDDAASQYDAAVGWVEGARELPFDDVPEPVYLTFEEIDQRVRAEIAESYPADQARLDAALLAAVGVVDPGTDLVDLQSEVVGEGQIAGFYDPETGEMVTGTDDPGAPLEATDLVTLVHELGHAVVDQALGLPDEDLARRDADAGFAQRVLVEGDATMLMNDFSLAALDPRDLFGDVDAAEIARRQAGLETAPHYLARQLVFPYTQGLEFACALREEGGWRAVDAAYRDLPTTSAQVMWPQRYLDGEEAIDPPAPAGPGRGWQQARTTTFGAADLLFLFEAPGDDRGAALDDPVGRAAAWAGGEVTQFSGPGGDATAIVLVQRDGEPDLCDSMAQWYDAAFGALSGGGERFRADGGSQAASIRCAGDVVRVGIAPDLATAERLTG